MPCSAAQSCTSGPLNGTLEHGLLARVSIHGPQYLQPLPGDSLAYMVTGKLEVGQMQGPRKPKCTQNPHAGGGANVINSPSPHLVRTPGGSPRFLCQLLRLENKGTNQVTVLQGRSCTLGNMPPRPTWVPCWPLFPCSQSAVSTEESVARAVPGLGHRLPAGRWGGEGAGSQLLMSWGVTGRQDSL